MRAQVATLPKVWSSVDLSIGCNGDDNADHAWEQLSWFNKDDVVSILVNESEALSDKENIFCSLARVWHLCSVSSFWICKASVELL